MPAKRPKPRSPTSAPSPCTDDGVGAPAPAPAPPPSSAPTSGVLNPGASPIVLGVTDAGDGQAISGRVQMADIARLAGVSIATVSRALNGSPLVSAETRERIQTLARSFHYAINLGAKNLRQRTNNTVAVVIPINRAARQPISDPFFLAMLGALADALTDRGFDMLVSRVDTDSLDAAVQLVNGGAVLGVIMVGQWNLHDELNQLAARRLPIAVWGAQLPQQLYCTVGGDNVEGGWLAADHLLQLGCRRIAFLGDPGLPEVSFRHRGYLDAHRQRRVPVDDRLCLRVAFDADAARAAVSSLCEAGIAFDAVFASSDVLASAAIQALHHHGLVVPGDVSVVGFDDSPLAVHTNPPLTTIRQPITRAGNELVDVLLGLIDGRHEPPRALPVELVIRGSTRTCTR